MLAATGVLLAGCSASGNGSSPQSAVESAQALLDSLTQTQAPSSAPTLDETWVPAGYKTLTADGTIAGKWNTSGDPCGYSRCRFVNLTAISRDGCPGGLFVTVNFLDGDAVVDDSIDSISSLRPMQKVKMVFKTYDNSGTKYQVSKVNCF
jgi:hypothetical protein